MNLGKCVTCAKTVYDIEVNLKYFFFCDFKKIFFKFDQILEKKNKKIKK